MKLSGEPKHLATFISKMEKEGLPAVVIDSFSYYYKKVIEGETGRIYNRDIHAVEPEELKDATTLTDFAGSGMRAFKNAVMLKLNGGLGTSMVTEWGTHHLVYIARRKW